MVGNPFLQLKIFSFIISKKCNSETKLKSGYFQDILLKAVL